MSKEDIIELLMDNQSTIITMAEIVNKRLIDSSQLFDDEVQTQLYDNIKKELLLELYNKDLTYEDVHAKIGEEELIIFIKGVLNNARN